MTLEYFRWAKEVSFNPKKETKKDYKYDQFIRRLLVVSLLPGVLLTIITFFAASWVGEQTGSMFGAFSAFVYIPIFLLSAVINPFISGAIIHFFGKIVFQLMKKDYKKTYNAAAYSLAPSFLFGWIPVVGSFVGGIWSIVVQVYALSNQQGITPSRALLVVLIPVIILVAVVILFAGASYSLVGENLISGNFVQSAVPGI
jgi:hypothetical protein